MELKLKNVTSYNKDNFTTLNLSKKINILYGQNGSGKSTISNFFYNQAHFDYRECECSLLENFRPLVYNSKFIEDNFYNTKEQKGVFTLSKENADIEKEILERDGVKQSLTDLYKEKKETLGKLLETKKKAEEICVESVWSKTELFRTSDLKLLMSGFLGSKKTFFSQVKNSPRFTETELNTLSKEYSELLKHKNNELLLITNLNKDIISSQDTTLLATPIIDSSNSYLSETIEKLQNLDWVKKGKEFYINGSTCPFCQESTITEGFLKAIKSIFDESYIQKISQISNIKSTYEQLTQNHLRTLHRDISYCEIIDEEAKEKSVAYIKILEGVVEKNIAIIMEKVKNPSLKVTLEQDKETEENLISDINEYNKKIREINTKVKKFKESEKNIKSKVWGVVRDFCNVDYETLYQNEVTYTKEHDKIQKEIDEVVEKGKDNSTKIKELRSQVSNIDSTIDSINLKLKNLGIVGFNIRKHTESEDKYIISREENPANDNVYKSLSEGEKTLITFLYFLECCKGKTDKEDEDVRDAFIVIDDPISSLSQNYIYDIASIINFEIIKNATTKKVLILTHNLYFFHELIKLAPKSKEDKVFKRDYYLGRITKNYFSIITDVDKNSIQNEYQSLWQILKDAKNGRINKIITPNIMRNILEYYFAFVHKTDALQAELTKLANDDGDNDFRSFYRFINRGSHSDAVNITDMGDIEPEKYMKQLRKIFRIMGDEKHFIKMMDMDEEEDVATA